MNYKSPYWTLNELKTESVRIHFRNVTEKVLSSSQKLLSAKLFKIVCLIEKGGIRLLQDYYCTYWGTATLNRILCEIAKSNFPPFSTERFNYKILFLMLKIIQLTETASAVFTVILFISTSSVVNSLKLLPLCPL